MGYWVLSAVSSFGFGSLVLLGLILPRLGKGSFWPPTEPNTWQARSARWLFRLGVAALLALSVWMFLNAEVAPPYAGQGAVMWGIGFGMAVRIARSMGWATAFGAGKDLVTTGWFARSRNPVYLAAWFGMIGWALLVPEPEVLVPLLLWALFCGLAAFWEERWLRDTYGAVYEDYAASVPRFF
jgi:protein-S-isoprenylcysteine O-methyltransferase Ste14